MSILAVGIVAVAVSPNYADRADGKPPLIGRSVRRSNTMTGVDHETFAGWVEVARRGDSRSARFTRNS
jgi:hypothetical protein